MSVRKYKVLLFDADGTLFDFEQSERLALQDTFHDFSIAYDPDIHMRLYQEINSKIWIEFEEHTITADALKTERFRRLFERLKIDVDPILFSDRYLNMLSQNSFLLDHAADMVVKLFHDYKMVLITNGLSSVQHPRFRKSAIFQYFDAVIVSEDIGIAKPHVGIFEHTMKRIGHDQKNDVLMIGDNLRSDIQGGMNFGIDTCWYNPEMKKNLNGITPTYEINHLLELEHILR
ncbi:YjjG family noncanonical pyrimidine nucleotidase [bacterium]|nr:YjjG family noncanonical pyrimidine nucleotidase [bacterium]